MLILSTFVPRYLLHPSLSSPSLSLSPHVSLQIRFPPPSILSRYPYILSLFAGSLCGRHVQYTYTSTLIPTRPISLFKFCIRAIVPPSLLNIFSSAIHVSCVSVAVGFLQAVASSSCQILSAPLQLSCPCNRAFLSTPHSLQ